MAEHGWNVWIVKFSLFLYLYKYNKNPKKNQKQKVYKKVEGQIHPHELNVGPHSFYDTLTNKIDL